MELVYEEFPGSYDKLFETFSRCCDDPLIEVAIEPQDVDDINIDFYGVIRYFHCFGCGSFFS